MGTHKRFDDDENGKALDVPDANASSQVHRKPRGISKPAKGRGGQIGGNKRKTKSVRSQIRSIERLLKNKAQSLTPAAKKAKEEQLQELFRLRDEHDRREVEKKTATKYRMVKFFERRKLQRTFDKIIQHGDKPEDAEKKKQVLRDIRYINDFPKDKKYIALFPSGGHSDESRKRVEAMRLEIEGKVTMGAVPDKNAIEEDAGLNNDDFFIDDESG